MSNANSPTSRRGRPAKRRLDTDAGAGTDAGSVDSGERPGDPGTTTGMGDQSSQLDPAIEQLAREIVRTHHSSKAEAYRIARRRLEGQQRSNTTASSGAGPDSAAPDSQPAETPANPTFTTENVSGSRRGRKPKLDPEATGFISANLRLMLEALASAAAGQEMQLTENEQQLIIGPATRILQRLQPDTVKAISTLSDPAALVFGSLMLIGRVQSTRRDNDQRRRPPPPPPPPVAPPTNGAATPTDEQIKSDGHLVDIPAAFTGATYTGVDSD